MLFILSRFIQACFIACHGTAMEIPNIQCFWFLQLWSIYAAGNTVPIPILRATDISPIALLSDNVLGAMQHDNKGTVAVEALQELFTGDGQSKKGRRGQNEVRPLALSLYVCAPYTFACLIGCLMWYRFPSLQVSTKGSLQVPRY